MSLRWHIGNVLEGLIVGALFLWAGAEFGSWQFWGPFTAWALISSVVDTFRDCK